MKFKDAIILPRSVMSWNWAWDPTDKMSHDPGVRKKDLDKLIPQEEL